MKIAVISDIHVDEQENEIAFTKAFSECVNELDPDYLLIAGDISEYYLRTLAFIRRLREQISAELYFCSGNHDLWSKYEPAMSAQGILNYMAGPKGDMGFLHNKAVRLSDKTVLVAGCGWYDYTFAREGMFSHEELREKEYMGRWWRDGLYARHGMEDEEVNRLWNAELQALIDEYRDYDIILMTHMLNHPAFLVGESSRQYEIFKYFNGFLGSRGLHELTKNDSIKYAISGHVHYRNSFAEKGTRYMCRCLGYPKEYPAFGGEQDLKAQIMDAFEVINIERDG